MAIRRASNTFRRAVMILTVLGWVAPGVQICMAACSHPMAATMGHDRMGHESPALMDMPEQGMDASHACCATGGRADGEATRGEGSHGGGCADGDCHCTIDQAGDASEPVDAALVPTNVHEDWAPLLASHPAEGWRMVEPDRAMPLLHALHDPRAESPPPLYLLNAAFLN